MAEGLQRRIEAMLMALAQTGSKAAALGAFVYPSSMTWSGRGYGSMLSIAPRNHPWRNIDPMDNSAVMNCLAWIFRNFGQGVLRAVREQHDGALKQVEVPGFLDLVYKPNQFHTAMSFWAGTLLSYHLDGNAYWIKIRDARGFGVPTALWYEPHWSIKPHWPEDGSRFIDYYERRVNGQIQKIPVENVVHFRNGLNPANTRYGLAPLKVALLEVFTDQEAAMYTASLLKNMAIPGVVASPKTPIGLTPEKAEQIKQRWEQRFGGDNRGSFLLLDFEADVTTLGFSPDEMNFTEIRRIGEERISGCFGLPAIVAGLGAGLDASTYNNLKELKKSAFEDCLSPTWDDFAETITNRLLVDFTDDETVIADFDISKIAALKEDQDQLNKRVVDRVRAGVILVSQAQADLGYQPDPSANYYLLPNNARPATAAVAMARAGREIAEPQTRPAVSEDEEREDGGKKLPPSSLKKKAYEWAGLELRRQPTPLEELIDIKQIDSVMRISAASFGSVLLGLRNIFIEQAIRGLGDLDASDYHALVIEVAAQDAGQVETLAEEQYLVGAELIAEELQRQQAGLGDAVTRAVEDAAVRLLTSLSRVTVSRLANDVQARVIAAAQQAALLGVEDVPGAVYSAMRDGSTGYVDRAARAAANASLAAGRRAEIKARPGEIRVVVYSAVLDANTCRPCGEDDGETGQVDEITSVPNPHCPGGGECRCVHIAVSELSDVEVGPRAPAGPTPPTSPVAPAPQSEPAPETALEAHIRLAEIFAEVEQEKEERIARRRELAEQFVAAKGRKRKQIERQIVEMDRSEAEIQDRALERYRAVMYQDAPAQFIVARAGQFDARANRNIDEGVEVFARLIGAGKLDGKTVTFYPEIDRSYYDNQGGVHITGTLTNGVIHEIGHWLEDLSPTIHDELLGFYAARTQGDALEKMADLRPGWGYGDAEITKKDRFANAYMGIYYEHNGRQYQTELLSMALQFLYEDPLGFADKDREMFDFIFELLRK